MIKTIQRAKMIKLYSELKWLKLYTASSSIQLNSKQWIKYTYMFADLGNLVTYIFYVICN